MITNPIPSQLSLSKRLDVDQYFLALQVVIPYKGIPKQLSDFMLAACTKSTPTHRPTFQTRNRHTRGCGAGTVSRSHHKSGENNISSASYLPRST